MKIPHTHTNLKLYKSKGGKTITAFYTFRVKLSDALEEKEEREKRKKEKKERKKRKKKKKKKRKKKKYNEVFKVA